MSGDAFRWHLSREVTVAHIIATVMLSGSIISWGMSVDTRITRLETQQAAHAAALERAIQTVDARLDRIENKVDRLLGARPWTESP